MTVHAALAIEGGRPVRAAMLPYGRHRVDQADVDAVVAALRSVALAAGLGPRDEATTTLPDFAATANCVRNLEVTVGFADVQRDNAQPRSRRLAGCE